MDVLSFNDLPSAIAQIQAQQEKILSLLAHPEPEPEKDRLLSIQELIDFLPEQPAKATVYGWVFHRKIPYEKSGKKLYFRKSTIQNWLDNGRNMNVLS